MTGRLRSRAILVCVAAILLVGMAAGCQGGAPVSPETPEPATPQLPPPTQPAEASPTLPAPPAPPAVPPSTPPQGETEKTAVIPFAQVEQARQLYPPDVTRGLLMGTIPAPAGFQECLAEQMGQARLKELGTGSVEPTGQENDIAAVCLMKLAVPPESLHVTTLPPPGRQPQHPPPGVQAVNVDSEYRVAPGGLSGWFTSGQAADIMLSGIDFNDSGGPLLFNHPKGIATDGTRLLLADGNNNRVLIWNSLPTGNTPPDLVLGQPDSISNNPGTDLDQMNWPAGVATDGQHVLVADTYNDRILIWNQFPTQNGVPADIVLDGKSGFQFGKPSKTGFGWPWGVWTNGEKLVVTSTSGGYALIWNTFPTRDNQPADLYLTAGGDMGTPRTITSDGNHLIIGDHNARNTSGDIGNFFWKRFPTTDDAPYDFFSPDPLDSRGAWMQGDFTLDGKLVMLGSTLHVWDQFPASASDPPALSVSGFRFAGGDGAGLAVAGNRIYVSLYNGNRIVAYNNIPTSPQQEPDFAIGSPDIHTNTLDTHYFITNGVPATDGKSLFVSSDFDRKLYVWKQIPDQSGAYPDLVYLLPEAPWDNALWGNMLALAGKDTVFLWKELPTAGQPPDDIYQRGIGGIRLKNITGVALDDRHFYLSDFDANRVYVWEGIPAADTPPAFSLSVDSPWRLFSDGKYLAVTSIFNHTVYLYRVADLSASTRPAAIGGVGTFNLPQNAIVTQGSLFIADTGFNQVHVWKNVADAIAGKGPDVILGKGGQGTPPLQLKDALFWPAGLAFDGSYLWVGEFKFSGRLLRFSVQ